MLTREDICRMLNVTADVLRKRIEPRPDFPKPALRLSQKTVRWEAADVQRWIQQQKARA